MHMLVFAAPELRGVLLNPWASALLMAIRRILARIEPREMAHG